MSAISPLFRLSLSLGLIASISAVDATPHFTRQTTWQESLLASATAIAAEEVSVADRSDPNLWPGLRVVGWSALGPFPVPSGSATEPLNIVHLPVTANTVDVTLTHGGLAWTPCPELSGLELRYDPVMKEFLGRIGKKMVADQKRVPVNYLSCRLESDHDQVVAATMVLPIDDWQSNTKCAVWLNGSLVNRGSDNIGGFQGGHPNVRLHWKKGINHLLCQFIGQPSISIKPLAEASSKPSDHILAPYWNRLRSEFPEPTLRRQMQWELADGIWSGPVKNLSSSIEPRLRKVIAEARVQPPAPNADSASIRAKYYLAKQYQTFDAFSAANGAADSLQKAIQDLITRHGTRYAKGPEYLKNLADLLASAKKSKDAARTGTAEAVMAFSTAVDGLLDLQREALLANPAVNFDDLLVVRRFSSVAGVRVDNGIEPGYPVSWATTASLWTHGWENDIARASIRTTKGGMQVVQPNRDSAYIGHLDLHWDAQRLLFTSVDTEGRYQLYERRLDSGAVRQVTRDADNRVDNLEGVYLPPYSVI